ncbi:hypothetical protein KR044_006994, partial [Drosophila immigrans]
CWQITETLTTNCCPEGETQANPIDCTQYYVCTNGVLVSQSCTSGNYWNSATSQCEQNSGQCCPGTCSGNDLQVDPQNCAAYYQCVNGQIVSQKCPSKTYFDSSIKACVVDSEGVCLPGDVKLDPTDCTKYFVCCTGKFKPMSCPSGEYWNAGAGECAVDNGECNCNGQTCTEGDIIADADNCANFKICVNGKYQSEPCPSGEYWNSGAMQCQTDEGQCNGTPAPPVCVDGDLKAHDSNCAGFFNCTNGQWVAQLCSAGNYWNALDKKCQKDEGQCNGTPAPECVDGEVKKNPSNCAGYFSCINGEFVAQLCGTGLYWNADEKQCQKDEGQCNNPPGPGCTEGNAIPDPSDCAAFYNCSNSQLVHQVCGSGLYFNADAKKCQKDEGQCKPTPSPVCVEGTVTANPANCAGFLECINNVWVARQCAPTNYFDTSANKCVVDSEGVCVPKVCDPDCCDRPNDWMGPVDKNCSAYIHCVYGNKFQVRCPNNLQFNDDTKQCDYPENVKCEDGSAPPSGPTAGPSGTYCEAKGRCVGQPDGEMLGIPNTCSNAYIVCQCECEINFACNAGLIFNPKINVCDWPNNVDA